jgi:molybdopterin synthase catalytic subunit
VPCEILATPLSVDACIARVAHAGAGAVVVMLGTVRDHTTKDGRRVDVTRLEYEAYTAMAIRVIDDVMAGVVAAHPGVRAWVQHRTGDLAVGDLAVVVAASSPHRAAAFAACAAIIDGLKKDAPIWKREHDHDGVCWVGLGP